MTPERFRRYALWGAIFCGAVVCLGAGSALRGLGVVFNPVLWASIQVIGSFLCFSIAANVFVRFLGTQNRTSLILGLAFGLVGFIEIAGILEFRTRLPLPGGSVGSPPLLAWMIGQTLVGLLLLLAFPIERGLPWPRQPRKTVLAVASVVLAAGYLISVTIVALRPWFAGEAGRALARPGELAPAAIFVAAAVVLRRHAYRSRCAFDAMLIWFAGIGAVCHLIAAQSAMPLDAPAMAAQLLHAASYAVLFGATLVDNVRLFGEVRDRAISDSLTSLANYRQFLDVLQAELERFGRTSRPFCVLLLDLDGLKQINDALGHSVGTRAICRVAEVLRLHSRSVDTAARYGGDEFGLVLPETGGRAALQVATRIRQHLAGDAEEPSLSVSIGIATCPENGASIQHLLDAADRDLYSAKALTKKSRTWRQMSLGL